MSTADDTLLQKKAYKEVLEPLDVRIARTRSFLEFFKLGLVYDIVPINDVYGPTAVDPNMQALVVSKETLSGATSSELPFMNILHLSLLHPSHSPSHNLHMSFVSPFASPNPGSSLSISEKHRNEI